MTEAHTSYKVEMSTANDISGPCKWCEENIGKRYYYYKNEKEGLWTLYLCLKDDATIVHIWEFRRAKDALMFSIIWA